jgi:hypothetical protein
VASRHSERLAQRFTNGWRDQYVTTLSGRGEIEPSDGKRISLEQGRLVLGEDMTGKGHITRAVGSEDWVSVHVSLADQ